MPLLCQQVQLLANHRGSQRGVFLFTKPGDPEGRPGALQSQSLPSLQQVHVVGIIRRKNLRRSYSNKDKNMRLTENDPVSCFTDGFRIESTSAPFLSHIGTNGLPKEQAGGRKQKENGSSVIALLQIITDNGAIVYFRFHFVSVFLFFLLLQFLARIVLGYL